MLILNYFVSQRLSLSVQQTQENFISGQSSSFSHYPYLDTDFKLIERIDPDKIYPTSSFSIH